MTREPLWVVGVTPTRPPTPPSAPKRSPPSAAAAYDSPMGSSADVTATFCATLVDEWRRGGVEHVVVSPGSRSTPMALAVADAADHGLGVHVHHDERSAGFLALGIGLASGHPAVVLTTSGTAAVELHPAVVEAHQARVPLIAVTADRPPERQDVGAAQTIDQVHLYGRSVRWFVAPGVPDGDTSPTWRRLAARAVAEAMGPVPGPVHLNLAFREPLVGTARPGGDQPEPGRAAVTVDRRRAGALDGGDLAELVRLTRVDRGLIVAGAGIADPDAVLSLAEALGWPVLADPRSGACRSGSPTVAAADAILRHCASTGDLRPDVVLRLGDPPASKVVGQWLADTGASQVLVHPHGAWIDPDHRIERIVHADVDATWLAPLLGGGSGRSRAQDRSWVQSWMERETAAQAAIERVLAGHPEPTEPALARTLLAALPDGATLVASSSMPIRDLEWYGAPRHGVRVLANRGANGIDGVTSTAVGVALANPRPAAPTAALIGDVALLHDTNGLLGLVRRAVDLVLVVADNDGGGIFSFLPQRGSVAPDRFELLFGTPHGVDLAALAALHGLPVTQPATAAEMAPAIEAAIAAGGPRVVHVRTDRDANVAVHDEIHTAVADAIDAL